MSCRMEKTLSKTIKEHTPAVLAIIFCSTPLLSFLKVNLVLGNGKLLTESNIVLDNFINLHSCSLSKD